MEQTEQREQIEAVLKYHLSERIITFHPIYAKILGGIEEAIFFQQICFWCDKGHRDDGVIYKTAQDITGETTLSERVQQRVKKNLKTLGVLEIWLEKIKGAPTCHYRVVWQELRKRIMHFHQLSDSSISESTNREKNAFPSKQGNAPLSSERKPNAIPHGRRTYVNPTTQRIINVFIEKCKEQLNAKPVILVKDHRLVTAALNGGGLVEHQVIDLIDEWFTLGKADEDTIQFSQALSRNQVGRYKIRNNIST